MGWSVPAVADLNPPANGNAFSGSSHFVGMDLRTLSGNWRLAELSYKGRGVPNETHPCGFCVPRFASHHPTALRTVPSTFCSLKRLLAASDSSSSVGCWACYQAAEGNPPWRGPLRLIRHLHAPSLCLLVPGVLDICNASMLKRYRSGRQA